MSRCRLSPARSKNAPSQLRSWGETPTLRWWPTCRWGCVFAWNLSILNIWFTKVHMAVKHGIQIGQAINSLCSRGENQDQAAGGSSLDDGAQVTSFSSCCILATSSQRGGVATRRARTFSQPARSPEKKVAGRRGRWQPNSDILRAFFLLFKLSAKVTFPLKRIGTPLHRLQQGLVWNWTGAFYPQVLSSQESQ